MNEIICQKRIYLGKYAYDGKRRINPCFVEIELRNDNGHTELSICGEVWNQNQTDTWTCGQCLDTMRQIPLLNCKRLFREIYGLWASYHLNGMDAGTHRQAKALEGTGITDYDKQCEYLKSIGLYTDDLVDGEEIYGHEHEPERRKNYEYGHSWIVWRLPNDVVERVKEICNGSH